MRIKTEWLGCLKTNIEVSHKVFLEKDFPIMLHIVSCPPMPEGAFFTQRCTMTAKCVHGRHLSVFLICERGGIPDSVNSHYLLWSFTALCGNMKQTLAFYITFGTMTWIQSKSPDPSFYTNHSPRSELRDTNVWIWGHIYRQILHLYIKET